MLAESEKILGVIDLSRQVTNILKFQVAVSHD